MKAVITFVILVFAATGGLCVSAPKAPPVLIPVESIVNGDVILIGRTGLPLKTVMQIEGIWLDQYRDKPDVVLKDDKSRWSFRVTHIDGKPLTHDLRFGRHEVQSDEPSDESSKISDGEKWKIRAFEALQDYNFNLLGPPVQTSRHDYTPTLWYESQPQGREVHSTK